MGTMSNTRARWAAAAAALLMVAGAATSCQEQPTGPAGPTCGDSVETYNVGNPPVTDPPTVPAGWWSSDTRPNGTVALTNEFGSPAGATCRAVKMTTGENTQVEGVYQDKAQLFSFEEAGTPLGAIEEISYRSFRSSASTGGGAPAMALNIQITGTNVPGNFATLVYEPYNQSAGQEAIVDDEWQFWDATATTPGDGEWWSTRPVGGQATQSTEVNWDTIQGLYPGATILGYGFNLGSNNANQIVAGDDLRLGDVLTNF